MTCSRRVAVRSEFEGSGRASGACGRGLHRPRTSPPLERPAERCGPRAGAASRPIRAEARRPALNDFMCKGTIKGVREKCRSRW